MKKTFIRQFTNIRQGGIIAINIREDDELVNVEISKGDDKILVGTRLGKGMVKGLAFALEACGV